MKESDKNNLVIDDILKQIKTEVARRREFYQSGNVHDAMHPDVFPDHVVRESRLYRLIKKIQFRLMKYRFYGALYGVAVRFKKFIPRYQKRK